MMFLCTLAELNSQFHKQNLKAVEKSLCQLNACQIPLMMTPDIKTYILHTLFVDIELMVHKKSSSREYPF